MKKSLLILAIFFAFNSIAYAQFPESEPNLLSNKEIVVTSKPNYSSNLHNFYTDSDLKVRYSGTFENLVGKKFNVQSVEPFKNSIGKDKFKLTLENDELKTLYYDYSPDSYILFHLRLLVD